MREPSALRHWFLTWTTYGTWLPGDERGFVSPVRNDSGGWTLRNRPGTACARDVPDLKRAAQARLKCPPISLHFAQAQIVLDQFRETATYRGWELLAVAVMREHVHLLVAVPEDPEPATLLRDFKSYSSRALNRQWSKPASGTWWTESGSKRRKRDRASVVAAVRYVARQRNPLLVWIDPKWEHMLTVSPTASGGRKPPSS